MSGRRSSSPDGAVGRESRAATVEYALSNGFGFGEVNASVIFPRREA
jgi:3-oxoacyl-(acyl-carrier-protein) synthase